MNFAELNLVHRGNASQTLNIVRRAVRMGFDVVVVAVDVADFCRTKTSETNDGPPKKKKRKSQAGEAADDDKIPDERTEPDYIPDPFLVDVKQLDLSVMQQTGRTFRQFSRLTISLTDTTSVHRLFQHPKLKLYDIVAVRFEDEQILNTLQRKGDRVDLITIDADAGRVSWLHKPKIVQACIAAGLTIELTFARALTASSARRQFFSNARLLMNVTRGGRGVVLSSGAEEMISIRAPYDVANLCALFGVDARNARKFVSANAKAMLLRAQSRRTIKGAIHVTTDLDKIPASEGRTPKETLDDLISVPEFRKQLPAAVAKLS